MDIKLLKHTDSPDETVYRAAVICYSKDFAPDGPIDSQKVKKLLTNLYQSGHLSTFEHASFTFGISGISRVTTHQLVRHRLASFSQQSQRYVEESADHADIIVPPSVESNPGAKEKFLSAADAALKTYRELRESGVPAEDARFVLPHGWSTKIVVTMNARELDHFFSLRMCERAQWEIRDLAREMHRQCVAVAPFLFVKSGPACVRGDCRETHPSGRHPVK